MNYEFADQFRNVHRRSFLYIIGTGMQQGIKGKGRTLCQIIGIGTPGNGVGLHIIQAKRLSLTGIQTDGNLGVRLAEGLAQRIGSTGIILLVHQTYKVLWQLHNGYTLTTPLMAGQGS
jgi:hypothetical protein